MAYNDPYIVDNDASERSVKKNLGEGRVIYRQVATGYFEIGGLLDLDRKWQKPEKTKIALWLEVTKRIRKAIEETANYFLKGMDKSTGGKKDKYEFLLSLSSTFSSLSKTVCQIFDKSSFPFLKPEGICK
jgi:hypothetical protein